MTTNFDVITNRRGWDSGKWNTYEADVLPMWVADMDFPAADVILEAIQHRVQHGVFGYGDGYPTLKTVICERMHRLYNWTVTPEQVMFLPGVVCSLNVVHRAVAEPGAGVLMQPPIYPPFLTAPDNHGMVKQLAELVLTEKDGNRYYEIDFDAFEAAITPQTKLFMLCQPHNPIGRSFTRDELKRMMEICIRHDLIICSDEIHCELMLADFEHSPTATLDAAVAERCITLMAPSKTFNLPGLGLSFAIIQNPDLYAKMEKAQMGIVPHCNLLGVVAAEAAYTQAEAWRQELLRYLTANRDYVVDFVNQNLPGVRTTVPEATYLAWLDCRESGIEGEPFDFFLNEAKVALNQGSRFGEAGAGFVRLNFGCPRETLKQGLTQMQRALMTIDD